MTDLIYDSKNITKRLLQNNSLLSALIALAILFLTTQVSAIELEFNTSTIARQKANEQKATKNKIAENKLNESNSAKSNVNDNHISSEAFNSFHQCEKTFEYEVYFLKKNVGFLHRKITWAPSSGLEHKSLVTATVKSNSKVHFLFLNSTYQQTSYMHYSPEKNHFLTSSFSQKVTGLKSREMDTTISANGLSSTVTLDDEVVHYKSETLPLYDLDTLGVQMRLNLIQEKKNFSLFRQGSDEIKEYNFEVVGHEVINHEKWGELNTIKVIEVGEHKGTVLWFSVKHDHQLVKAKLDLIFSPVVWLNHFEIQCNKIPEAT